MNKKTSMYVKEFTIHEVIKKRGSTQTSTNLRTSSLDIDSKVVRFTKDVFTKFYENKKGLLFSDFVDKPILRIFSEHLSEYLKAQATTFHEFSTNVTTHLESTMQPVTGATGAFFILTVFEVDKTDYLLTLLVNQELAFAINEEDLSIKNVDALQLDKLGVGSIVDLNRWYKDEPEPVAYIRGQRDVSDYYMRFIGAEPEKRPKEATEDLVNHTKTFLRKNNIIGEKYNERLYRMSQYCLEQFNKKEPVELSVISSIVFQENPQKYLTTATRKKISSEFHIDRSRLTPLREVTYNKEGIRLRIARSSISSKRMSVNKRQRELTLKDIDMKTIEDLSSDL